MIDISSIFKFKKKEETGGCLAPSEDDPFKDRVWAYYFEMKSPSIIGIVGASFTQKGLTQTVTFKTFEEAYVHLISHESDLAEKGIGLAESVLTERARRIAQQILKKEEMMA